MSPNATLYLALGLYAAGTIAALMSLFVRGKALQQGGLGLMVAGFLSHTFWIGGVCVRTGHPPLTNLPETAAFLAWTVFAVELGLFIRYRVHAASFFVYPLVLMLLTITAIVREPFATGDPVFRSRILTTHILFTTVGVAGLLISLAFASLSLMQDRALKQKTRGRLWDWIPSLNVCKVVSYRALAIGFTVYTLGLLAGVLWSYRTTAGPMELRIKQIGAVVAWALFATLLQSHISGAYRTRKTILISACAFVAILVSMLGIHHA
jgi:ABC-type uncharacterized transport system, permease component